MNIEESYNHYFKDRLFEREDLLKKVVQRYKIKSALYPGSYTHVTPSFFIPDVTYVDSDSKAKKIFKNIDDVIELISQNKTYSSKPTVHFFGQSYTEDFPIRKPVDFLFSQYAGPISQACKKYLRKGGILIANNSHADAGIAFLDPDYQLVAVANNEGGRTTISEKNLNDYFIPKKEEKTIDELLESGKGIAYTKTADNYIFEKLI